MSYFEITGGAKMSGEICIAGAKNSSMPIIIASMLSDKQIIIHNIPFVSDVTNLLNIMACAGTDIAMNGNHNKTPSKSVLLTSKTINSTISNPRVSQIRTSILMMGALLAKNGYIKIAYPGGDDIGKRKIDLHIYAMRRLGATIIENLNFIEATTNGSCLKGNEINFEKISVGATESAIMAATLADGESIIRNIAIEPEIDDLIYFINKMGGKITKTGERELLVQGVTSLSSTEHFVMADRIEAATYAILASATGGEIVLRNCSIKTFDNIAGVLGKIGIDVVSHVTSDGIEAVRAYKTGEKFLPLNIETNPYPHFPTDLQPHIVTLLTMADGISTVRENIFEDRFRYIGELKRMGANIEINNNTAIIRGGTALHGGIDVYGGDVRATAALVQAAIIGTGKTRVYNIEHADRGYQNFERNLEHCGVDVKRFK